MPISEPSAACPNCKRQMEGICIHTDMAHATICDGCGKFDRFMSTDDWITYLVIELQERMSPGDLKPNVKQ